MITLTQKYINSDGSPAWESVHIYAPAGHFEQDGKACGWHIQLGTDSTADEFAEVSDGTAHDVPASLPDIIIMPAPEETEEAEIPDYEDALAELGVEA